MIRTLIAMALACAAATAAAAPYAVTYTGTIANSSFAQIVNGEHYSITFVFDNGGNTVVNQTWAAADLRCAIWRMNDAGNAVFAQDLSPLASPPTAATGAITTNGAGVLTGMFTGISSSPAGPDFSSSGFTHPVPLHWFANGSNSVLRDGAAIRSFDDVAGGVQMNPANWLLAPYGGGPCAAPVAPGVPPTPVPTLGHAALALLAGLVGLTGGARRRAQRRQRG
ncbi:MAG: IPTL-CTERM sorting domain-containing protein [Burkholderiaceae bacterium]